MNRPMITRRTTEVPPAARSRRRRRGSAAPGGGRGGRKGPVLWGLGALAVLSAAAAALTVNGTTSAASDTADRNGAAAGGEDLPSPQAPPSPSPSPSPPSSPSPSPSPSPSASVEEEGGPGAGEVSASPGAVPSTGPGTFTTAGGGSGTVGKGSRVLRYKVVVETGLAQSAAEVARQVEGVLADRRGWTADGRSGFRRVSSGKSDFVVRLATPGTVDEICGRYGLNTRGEVNCNVGKDVVVNLKRWLLATPVYADDVDAYRALIINHEVGHFLGHGHVTCPGAGKPAPAMMQQIKGMRGCTPNVWPYDTRGRLLTGPAVP